ncbi:MAG TPA: hypothetical protein VEZ70_08255 [Allosphingosinicella sp.]|nr:hypothetical protein [Allosphingosinicella sp.]
MNSFLFGRQRGQDAPQEAREIEADAMAQAALDIQSITTSAIFAMLVSKGVMSANEAAEYMADIAQVLARDVRHPQGAAAGQQLERYGNALVAADGEPS